MFAARQHAKGALGLTALALMDYGADMHEVAGTGVSMHSL